MRGLLIISELALTLVLMVGAGLLMRTFWRLMEEDPGFNSANVVASSISLPEPNDPKLDPYLDITRQAPFFKELLRRAHTIPGVELAEKVGAQSIIGQAAAKVFGQMLPLGMGDLNDSELIDALRVAHGRSPIVKV